MLPLLARACRPTVLRGAARRAAPAVLSLPPPIVHPRRAGGTYARDGALFEENHWEVPAAFLGLAHDGKVTHWQVFSDTTMIFDLIKANE